VRETFVTWSVEEAKKDRHEFTIPIDEIMAHRFCYAVTNHNPIYFDDEAARAAGYERMVAHPTLISSILDYQAGPPEDGLREDGVDFDIFPVPSDALLMGGGQEIDFIAPVYVGDRITFVRTVHDIVTKPSRRFGELTFVVMDSVGKNQVGAEVMRIRDTLIVAKPS